MRRFLLAVTLLVPAHAYAVIPVEDIPVLGQMLTTVQQGAQILSEAKSTVGALTNIPREAIGEITGLLEQGIGNPLQGIHLNLQSLLTGSGTGTCSGSSGMLALQQYQGASGGDFMGASMNGSAARLAGLQACTQQMLEAQEQRLNELPGILDQLKGCNDVACTTAIAGRLNYENAVQTAQNNEAVLIGWNAQLQRWTADDQIAQKQRADEQQLINATGGNNSGIGSPIQMQAAPTIAPMFGSDGGGG